MMKQLFKKIKSIKNFETAVKKVLNVIGGWFRKPEMPSYNMVKLSIIKKNKYFTDC